MNQPDARDGQHLSALILEDSERDARRLTEELERGGFRVQHRRVATSEACRQALADEEWNVVLAGDGQIGSLDALQLVREYRRELPLLLVCRSGDDEGVLEALDAGADDFVLKSQLSRLVPAVRRAVRATEDRRVRERAEEALRESEERYRDLVENANDVVLRVDLRGNFTSMNRAGELLSGYSREELTKMNMQQVLTPESFQRAGEMIAQKLVDNLPTIYELEMIARDGHHVPLEVSTRLICHDDVPVGIQGIARDITERKRGEQELRARERKQAAVAQLGQHALVSTDVSLLFNDTVSWVVHTLDVAYCTILELSQEGNELIGRAGSGWNTELVGRGRVGSGPQSFAGFTLLSSEPVIVEDFSTETRFSVPEILRAHQVRSGLSVIIAGSQIPFGVLTVFTDNPREFSRDDVHFLQSVANVLAAAIERKRLEDERARHTQELATRVLQAQEEERKRIARELHDDTAQSLSMLLTNLDLLEPSIEKGNSSLAAGFRRVASLARRTLDAVRSISHDLRPTILDDAGLEAALEWVAAEYEREFHGAAFVDTRIAGDIELTPEIEVALFRIAQEALTNSGKHAGATTVWIRLRFEDRTAVLTVEDNGRGFDPTSVPRPTRDGRLGMYGMRERAALFGGSLTIDASPGKGTLVRATLPLPESKPALEPEPVFTIERGEQ